MTALDQVRFRMLKPDPELRLAMAFVRRGNLMRLAPGRVDGMVADAVANQSVIVCHKTLDGDNAACRGFVDLHGDEVPALRIAPIVEDP